MKRKLHLSHPWEVNLAEAERIQNTYRQKVRISPLTDKQQSCITAIAVRDLSEALFVAAVTTTLEIDSIQIATGKERATFPYYSGYLAFRYMPAMLQTIAQLKQLGDVIIVSGHGLAHPRRFGLASHLGVLLDIPTISCAQNRLPGNELLSSEDPLVD